MSGGLASKLFVAAIIWLPLCSFVIGGVTQVGNASQQILADSGMCKHGSQDITRIVRGDDGKLHRAETRQACAKK